MLDKKNALQAVDLSRSPAAELAPFANRE